MNIRPPWYLSNIALTVWILAILATLFFLLPASAHAQTGSFELSTTVHGDGTLTPTLTWSTTPDALGCTASGNPAWDGNKANAGTQTLPPVSASEPQAYALLCTWPGDVQALIRWTAPTQNTDGSTLNNLAGFRVYHSQSLPGIGAATPITISDPSATFHRITNLTAGTWYFGVLAFTSQGAQSALSGIVSKTATATSEWTQQTGIRVPKAPGISLE